MTRRKPNPQRGGRKRLGNVRHTVSLTPALWAHVDAQAGETRSARLAVVVGRDMEQQEFLEYQEVVRKRVELRRQQGEL